MTWDKTLSWNSFFELYRAASPDTLLWLARHLADVGPVDEVIEVVTSGNIPERVCEMLLEPCIANETLTMGQMYDLMGDLSGYSLSRLIAHCVDILPPIDMIGFYGHVSDDVFVPLYMRSLFADPEGINAEVIHQAAQVLDQDHLDRICSGISMTPNRLAAIASIADYLSPLGKSMALLRAIAAGMHLDAEVMTALTMDLDNDMLHDALRLARDAHNTDAVLALELMLADDLSEDTRTPLSVEEIVSMMLSAASYPEYKRDRNGQLTAPSESTE